MTIRVLIADDHPVFRYGLRSVLANADDIAVVGEAASAAEAVAEVQRLQPDVLVLDVRLPGPSGIDVAKVLRRKGSETRILVLTAYESEEYLIDALSVGVDGYLLKHSSYTTLISSIRKIHAGRRLVTQEQMDSVLEEFERLSQRVVREESELTASELRVLGHLAQGKTYAEIGEALYVSASTVKRRIQSAIDKMGAHSRTEAVAKAIRQGLI